MDEPDKQDEGKDSFINKMKEKARFNNNGPSSGGHSREKFAGVLVFLGLVLAFFYLHLGALLVGLGFGICFYQEIAQVIALSKKSYSQQGLIKILVAIATLLFLLLSIPFFLIAAMIGFGAMHLILKKK